jgi:hypothetical protein
MATGEGDIAPTYIYRHVSTELKTIEFHITSMSHAGIVHKFDGF